MNVNFEYYKIFYYVAKYLNFTRAAEALHSNQPNVTRAMNKLEDETGCTLFIRTNKGVSLTPEGERLYAHVSGAMNQLMTAEHEMEQAESLEHGSISISASETALDLLLLDELKKFHLEHPKIQLKILNHSTPQALRAVRDGIVDFSVVTTPANSDSSIKITPLLSFQEILTGGSTFSEIANKPLHLSDIKAHPFICLGKDTMTYEFYRKLFLREKLDFEPDTEVSTADQLLPMVKSEIGLAFIPEPIANRSIQTKEIVKMNLIDEIPERKVCLAHDPNRPISAAAFKLKEQILNHSFSK
jgi:DNA-binding transcriptional LysR family regulator